MEESKSQENIIENKNTSESAVGKIVTPDSVRNEIIEIPLKIENNQNTIKNTTEDVNKMRHELGLTGEEPNIPSIEPNKNEIVKLENKKAELEKKLVELLKSDVSLKYEETISKVRQSKIDWAVSEELARRLRLKGADESDVSNIREWLVGNANNAKTFILPPSKFKEVVDVLSEMTGDDGLKEGIAFHIPGGRDDVPENIKSSVFLKEQMARPPLPGQVESPKETINTTTLSHELGHVTQDGLLQADEFEGTWKPKFIEGAPDKEYVGSLTETDTRIRSMFNALGDSYDPHKEVFGKKHLEILRIKQSMGMLDKDVKDLFSHYDDAELLKIANRTPAI